MSEQTKSLEQINAEIRLLEHRQVRLSTCGYDDSADKIQAELALLYRQRDELLDQCQKTKGS